MFCLDFEIFLDFVFSGQVSVGKKKGDVMFFCEPIGVEQRLN